MRATFDQNSVHCDEWGGCLVDQNGHVGIGPLRASHGDAFVPEGFALLELNTSGGVLDVLLPEVVLLNK